MNHFAKRQRLQALTLTGLVLSATSTARAEVKGAVDYRVSWIGNTLPGSPAWVQQDIEAIQVAPDGTVYTNVGWDEGGRNVGAYKDGQAVANAGHTHGWGYNGGRAVAFNDKYLFIAQRMDNEGGGLKDKSTWPPKSFGWLGISRRLRSDISKAAPFRGGKGGQGDTLKEAFLIVSQVPDDSKLAILGLCADNGRIYVSDPLSKTVKIFNAETMALLSSWPLEEAGPMLLDKQQSLWILQAASKARPARILRVDTAGKKLAQQILFAPDVVPSAMCLDARGRLLVADQGASQQILIYDNLGRQPKLVGALGQKGGIYAGVRGRVGDWRLNHVNALGCDAQNNLYIAHGASSGGGSTLLESYAPSKALRWRLQGLVFVDMADADPNSLGAGEVGDVFTKEERFRMDYSRPRGSEWRYAGYTIDPARFPQDPRLHIWSAGAWVRRVNGQRLLFVNDMNAEYLQVYRFENNSEIAVPCALFSKRHIEVKDKNGNAWPPGQPAKGEWIWRDANGNGAFEAGEYIRNGDDNTPESQGWWVDEAGNVWLATEQRGIWMFPIKPLNARGIPQWGFVSMRAFEPLPEFENLKRLRYDAARDVLYAGGTTAEHKNQHWKPMGPVIARYDNWLRGKREKRWQIVAPYARGSSGHESCEPMGFDVAGEFVFVPYTGASKERKFSTGHIEIFRADDGSSSGSMEPSADIGEIGLQDIRECLAVRQRPNGEYLVFLEEDFKSKILMYRARFAAPLASAPAP